MALFFYKININYKYSCLYLQKKMHFLYFDPGLGAMLIQAIVAAVAGVILFSKNLMYNIKSFLGLAKKEDIDMFDDINVDDTDIETKESSDN